MTMWWDGGVLSQILLSHGGFALSYLSVSHALQQGCSTVLWELH